jgi:serine/threonine-protein kinase ULK/ATG1
MVKSIGPYILLKEIGRGAFGVVYEARDKQGTNSYAVKAITLSQLGKKAERRVEEEIQCMQKFQNRFVVRLFDILKSSRNLYLVMELVQGGDLQGVLDQKILIPEDIGRRLISQLVEALKLLHANRVIHRDLKPANILLTSKDLNEADVKVMDFGLSRNLLNVSMMAQSVVGSPVFMAPEVLKSDRYSFKADTWSLGALSFEILVGRQAFECTSLPDLKRRQKAPLDYPPDCRISEAARDFLRTMLTYDAELRPTMDQLQTHPFISQVPQVDLPPPVALRDSVIIEEPSEEEAEELPLPEQRKLKCSNAVMTLEKKAAEANFTKTLAASYEDNSTVALCLYRLYERQQQSNFEEALQIQRDYNMGRDDSLAFSNLYDQIQDELVVIEDVNATLELLVSSQGRIDVNELVMSEAHRVLGQGEETEGYLRAQLLLSALLLRQPGYKEAALLLEEVQLRHYST